MTRSAPRVPADRRAMRRTTGRTTTDRRERVAGAASGAVPDSRGCRPHPADRRSTRCAAAGGQPGRLGGRRRAAQKDAPGNFKVVVRDAAGGPVVISNSPFLEDGTPMPTLYWLVGRAERDLVSRLESTGGVRAAEAGPTPPSSKRPTAAMRHFVMRVVPPGHRGPSLRAVSAAPARA